MGAPTRKLVTCLTAVLLIAPAVTPTTPDPDFEPQVMPQLTASRAVENNFSIDGLLTDAGWRTAARADGFSERYPGENTRPAVATEAYITFDSDKLYVAFVCYDDPATLRATMCQRDQYFNDDAVELAIDPYGNAAWAYMLHVNPFGVQKDELWSNVVGEDLGFDLIWESAAVTTDSGYQVEMAIPFASMRFPNRDIQSWKMDFRRIRPRDAYYQYAWSAQNRNEQCGPCQWGTVDGIAGVEAGKGVEILPTYVATQSGSLSNPGDPATNFEQGDLMGEPSLGAKYSLSSDITAEGALNPDFSQIESDAAQVDVNTTIALFYPERRPFFQEGSDIFRTLFNSFYTRMVNDPFYAVKMTGRKEKYSFGFMSALDENTPYMIPLEEQTAVINSGQSVVNVLRASKTVGKDSQLGFILTDRRFEDNGYGTIVAADGDIRLSRNYSTDFQFLFSFTGEPEVAGESAALADVPIAGGKYSAVFDGEKFAGNAFIARLRRNARHWNFLIDFDGCEPDYRTETGYDPWVNYRQLSIWSGYTFYPSSGIFQRIQPQVYAERRWRFNDGRTWLDDGRWWSHLNLTVWNQLRFAQTNVSLSVQPSGTEVWFGHLYDDLWGGSIDINSRPSGQVGLSLHCNYGRSPALLAQAMGRELSAQTSVDFKLLDRLTIEPDVQYIRSTEVETDARLYRQFISRTRFNYQFSRTLSLRLVLEYNDRKLAVYTDGTDYAIYKSRTLGVAPLVTFRLSPFSVFYVGSTYDCRDYLPGREYQSLWKLRSQQFFMKLQYLFQI